MDAVIRLRKPLPTTECEGKTLVVCAAGKVELVPRHLMIHYSAKIADILAERPHDSVVIFEEDIRINFLLEFVHLKAINCKVVQLSPFIRTLDFLKIPYSLEVKHDGGFVCCG